MARETALEAWQGDLGTAYTQRHLLINEAQAIEVARPPLERAFSLTGRVSSVIEFGCGIGDNLAAINAIDPDIQLCGVEANGPAFEAACERAPNAEMHLTPVQHFLPADKYDLVLSRGFLIHVPPEVLPSVYDLIYRTAAKFILMGEYVNQEPTQIPFRGRTEILWKRDFPGEMRAKFPDLEMTAHWPPETPDPWSVHWFLLSRPH